MKLSRLFLESKKLEHVGIFIQLPDNLEKQYPRLADDSSPAHITTLYLGDQSSGDEDAIVAAAYAVAKETKPFKINIGNVGYFDKNKDGNKIAFTKIESSGLRSLRIHLTKELKKHGIKWKDKWGSFKPHVTLKYFEGIEGEYEGKVPSGSWICKELRVWGFQTKHIIKFED
jgi:2'-5' RNA ligase